MLNETQLALWHPTKNELDPGKLSPETTKKAWWLGDCGHEWEGAIRYISGLCPYCLNKRVLPGFNDLKHLYPLVAEQWHPTKNGKVTPSNIISTSTKKAWWVCDEGHEWEVYIRNRTAGSQCPYCTNYKTLKGFNDLKTKYPEIASEWHPTKNGNLEASQVGAKTSAKYWWLCKRGHEWKTQISHRTLNNSGCPKCNVNQTLLCDNEKLAKEFDKDKNKKLDFYTIRAYGQEKVWWKCSEEHTWEAQVYERFVGNTNCPICTNRKIKPGFNDLASTHSEALEEWDYNKNTLLPTQITSGSQKRIYWKCSEGHSWQASPNDRFKSNKKQSCPVCMNRIIVTGFNDLASRRPHLIPEWDSSKNKLNYEKVGYRSLEKVWWKCVKNHSWQARIYDRQAGQKCPQCVNKKMFSKPELELKEWLEYEGFEVFVSNRNLLKGYEVDLFIPAYRLGIEYNGIYWHRKEAKTKLYHMEKFFEAKDKGITLIQVWESEYLKNKNAIKNRILSYLKNSENITLDYEIRNDFLKIRMNSEQIAEFKITANGKKIYFYLTSWSSINLRVLVEKTTDFLKNEKKFNDMYFVIPNDWPLDSDKGWGKSFVEPSLKKVTANNIKFFDIYDSGKTIYKI